MENYFLKLHGINVNDKTEKKNGLTYLSWAFAWAEAKKLYPDTTYTIYENEQGWNYFTDGRTCWVKTGVTCNGIEHIEYLPVMDYRNRSMKVNEVTSFDVNKTIQRSLTKALARHGIGLYIYAGEDLPEEVPAEAPKEKKTASRKESPAPAPLPFTVPATIPEMTPQEVVETVKAIVSGIHDAQSANEALASIAAMNVGGNLKSEVNRILKNAAKEAGLAYSAQAKGFVVMHG